MLVLSRSREQTARHEPTVVPDAGVTDKPAVMPDILISIPEASMPIAAVVAEITVKKSVFRAEVFYTDNAQEAKETVKRQKDQYRDARHVVHAFVSGITNILVTVTRWFGGTLLGTGGLVKAYSTAAKEALAKVHTEPLIQKAEFTCECSYENHNPLLRAAAHLPISFAQTEFAQTVRLSGSIPLEYCNELAQLVTEITKGASSVRFSE